jgi:hypothetical protein
MNTKKILEKGVTFQDFIVLVRELQGKTDNEIAIDVFCDRTSDSTRKLLNIMLQHNYRLVAGKAYP